MKKLSLIISAAIIYTSAGSQVVNAIKTAAAKDGLYPGYVEFMQGTEPTFSTGKLFLTGKKGSVKSSDYTLGQAQKDELGYEHIRVQQTLSGLPVEGANYILHTRGGKVQSQNGIWVEDFPASLSGTPAIGKEAALQAAMKDFGAAAYKWQLPAEEAFIKAESGNRAASFYPTPSLVYYSGEGEVNPAGLVLAYKLDVYAHEPIGRRIYFIDANTGAVLGKREILHTTNATGSAITGYSGTQAITTDSVNGSFRLQETGRGSGIQTFDLKKGTSYAAAVDFTDADNTWNNVNANKDEYATDAHWGAEKTYDYFKLRYNRNSINNAGFAIKSYVHYSTNYFNAFWDGSRMTYGDGDASDGYKPLTAIDVCGHEITHGLTTFTANLIYSNESGALNEAFSDIFGTAIEFYARPSKADWLIGADFYTIRSMSNPNAYGDPDTYLGTNWYSGTGDNGGVHTNSGVLNYWFYLLSIGGSGTNDKGTAFSVTGIGIDKAAAIAYRTLTTYLVSSSTYADARTYSIKSAEDLYGIGSAEAVQTTNAWIAVGVSNVVTPTCTDSYEANESQTAAKTIALNTDISAKIGSGTDKDWFKITTLSTAPKLKITLTNLPADYDLKLYKSNGTQLKVSQNSGTTAETIAYNTATAGAVYYIQVYGYAGANSTSCYTLKASTGSVNFFDNPASLEVNGFKASDVLLAQNTVQVYPNPAKGKLMLRFNADADAVQPIIINDVLGRVVFKQAVNVTKGLNQVSLSLPEMTHGIYLLRLSDNKSAKFSIAQ